MDSLFGIPIQELEDISKAQAQRAKLEQLLAQGPAKPTTHMQRPLGRKADLASLKEELETILMADLEAGPREKRLVRRQRAALVQEIARLEAEERGEQLRGLKGMISFFFNVPPFCNERERI